MRFKHIIARDLIAEFAVTVKAPLPDPHIIHVYVEAERERITDQLQYYRLDGRPLTLQMSMRILHARVG